jgi:hypothetical protein
MAQSEFDQAVKDFHRNVGWMAVVAPLVMMLYVYVDGLTPKLVHSMWLTAAILVGGILLTEGLIWWLRRGDRRKRNGQGGAS